MLLADLDLLLTAVVATAHDRPSERTRNAKRRVTDAEVVALAVAQAKMDIASDRESWPSPAAGWGTCFPGAGSILARPSAAPPFRMVAVVSAAVLRTPAKADLRA